MVGCREIVIDLPHHIFYTIKAALADRKKVVKTGSISMDRGRCMCRGKLRRHRQGQCKGEVEGHGQEQCRGKVEEHGQGQYRGKG